MAWRAGAMLTIAIVMTAITAAATAQSGQAPRRVSRSSSRAWTRGQSECCGTLTCAPRSTSAAPSSASVVHSFHSVTRHLQLLELGPQARHRPREPRLHGARTDPERVGDLALAHVLEPTARDHHAVALR